MFQCMETHIEFAKNGDSCRGYNVWRLTQRIQCMDIHKVAIYGVSYRG